MLRKPKRVSFKFLSFRISIGTEVSDHLCRLDITEFSSEDICETLIHYYGGHGRSNFLKRA